MSYDPLQEENQASRSGIPSWVWVVGISAVVLICCVGGLIGTFVYLNQNADELFGDVGATLEAAFPTAVVPTGTPTAVAAQPLATPDIVATAMASFEESPETETEMDGLMATAMALFPAGSNEGDMLATAQAMLTAVPPKVDAPTPQPTLTGYDPYVEEFDRDGEWDLGEATADDGALEAEAYITGGVLDFTVQLPQAVFWSTSKNRLGNGTYEIEMTAVDGPLNNGFGLLFLGDDDTGDYYMFEISSDGYVWIGFYGGSGETVIALVEDGWFASDAVKQGLNQTNLLRVEVDSGTLEFFVNDEEVASIRDFKLLEGDVGVFIETLDEGDVRVHFDNLRYTPRP
ncbi:MAG: hypothetical protein IPL28_07725 [Chloroflexi bacterium]|nr:hypothetical protein [Chloroflexota bacterium]